MKLENLIKKELRLLKEGQGMTENYMFFKNIKQIHRQCQRLLELDQQTIDSILQDGHDWADDHISEAKTNIDQVFDFFMNEMQVEKRKDEPVKADPNFFEMNESQEIDESKNKPTNPKLWSRAKSLAKSKFKVYPSAYANGWASKWYKKHGGGWKKSKK